MGDNMEVSTHINVSSHVSLFMFCCEGYILSYTFIINSWSCTFNNEQENGIFLTGRQFFELSFFEFDVGGFSFCLS